MMPRVIFLGGTKRGLDLVHMLIRCNVDVAHAFIMPEDAHEPIQVADEIVKQVTANNIPYTLTKRLEEADAQTIINANADVGFCCSWRTIIKKNVYESFPLGCLVAHDSLLPKYRGFAPTAWAVINGEKETGVSLFKIKEGAADSGDIFAQKAIAIGPDQTSEELYPLICDATIQLFEEFLDAADQGDVTFKVQDETKATDALRRSPEDGLVNWTNSAQNIYNFCRALTPPYPYAWTRYQDQKYYLRKVQLVREPFDSGGAAAGTIIRVTEQGVHVACGGSDQLWIKTLITESGQTIEAATVFKSITETLV